MQGARHHFSRLPDDEAADRDDRQLALLLVEFCLVLWRDDNAHRPFERVATLFGVHPLGRFLLQISEEREIQ